MTTYTTTPLTVFELSGLHEDYENIILVSKFNVGEITVSKGYTLFTIEATYKTPKRDEEGNPIIKDNGFSDDMYITIKKTFFRGKPGEQEKNATFDRDYAFYGPWAYLPAVWISFHDCREKTYENSQTGKRSYKIEVTSPLTVHAERPEVLEALFATYREQEALTTSDEEDDDEESEGHHF